ncbi:huntingtin-interacting protein M [Thomomys bottae]
MSENKSQESTPKDSNHLQDSSSRSDIQLPVNYIYDILQEEQYMPCIGSTTSDFLLAMLDYVTDYILELVGSEASNSIRMAMSVQNGGGDGDNNERPDVFKDTSFSLFDNMPGPRRSG